MLAKRFLTGVHGGMDPGPRQDDDKQIPRALDDKADLALNI
jgi:hypothetical protein